jgi:hypothetical protein
MDVFAVERRNESLMQQLNCVARDAVGAFLDRFDIVGAPLQIIAARHERSKFTTRKHDLLRVLAE